LLWAAGMGGVLAICRRSGHGLSSVRRRGPAVCELVEVGGGLCGLSGPERVDRVERELEDVAVAEPGGRAED